MSQVLAKNATQARALADFILDSVADGEDEDGVLLTQQGDSIYVSGHLVSAIIAPDGDVDEN